MNGNLNLKRNNYYRFVIFPFRVIYGLFMLPFYLFMIFLVPIIGIAVIFGHYPSVGSALESFYEELGGPLSGLSEVINISSELIIPTIFIVWLVLFIVNKFIYLPLTNSVRRKIKAGTLIKINVKTPYKELIATGTKTTYYYYGMQTGSYDNYNTYKDDYYDTILATVESVKRNGFEIYALLQKEGKDGIYPLGNKFIKFKWLYKASMMVSWEIRGLGEWVEKNANSTITAMNVIDVELVQRYPSLLTSEEMYTLGKMYRGQYLFGFGKDEAKALEWVHLAAEHGHMDAQYDLAGCYQLGRGLPEDYAQAAYWYKKAGEQGHEHSQKSYERISEIYPELKSADSVDDIIGSLYS